MIQIIAAAAVGVVGLYAYSSFKKHMQAIKEEEERKAKKNTPPKEIGDLEQDPVSGKYRVKK